MFSKLGTKILLNRAGLGNGSLPSLPKSDGNGQSGVEGNGGFQNPFANVQWGVPKAFSSWQTPAPPPNSIREPPAVGDRAQSNMKLKFPPIDGRPCVVLFLRHCGCPFSEKLFIAMRSLSNRNASVRFIAVSHCTPAATEAWVKKVGGAWNVDVVVDQARELYALFGLGISNWGHVLNPRNGYNQILLGKQEGVWGGPVGEGGCRWQVGGVYAIDGKGIVKWGGPMKSVDEQLDFEEAIGALGFGSKTNRSPGGF